jgi:hypothetical protein
VRVFNSLPIEEALKHPRLQPIDAPTEMESVRGTHGPALR